MQAVCVRLAFVNLRIQGTGSVPELSVNCSWVEFLPWTLHCFLGQDTLLPLFLDLDPGVLMGTSHLKTGMD